MDERGTLHDLGVSPSVRWKTYQCQLLGRPSFRVGRIDGPSVHDVSQFYTVILHERARAHTLSFLLPFYLSLSFLYIQSLFLSQPTYKLASYLFLSPWYVNYFVLYSIHETPHMSLPRFSSSIYSSFDKHPIDSSLAGISSDPVFSQNLLISDYDIYFRACSTSQNFVRGPTEV